MKKQILDRFWMLDKKRFRWLRWGFLCFIFAKLYQPAATISLLYADEKKESGEKQVTSSQSKIVEERIQSSVNKVLAILKDKNLDKETKKVEVRKVVDPLFDIPLMAKLVIGRKHWAKFTEPQRKEFTELFIQALQDSYFEKVDLLTDEYVEFEKPVPQGNKFQMLTYILAKDKRYKMLFKLYWKAGEWRVYDVEIEGVSFVRSYGAQYDEFLQKHSIQELLSRLREKTMEVPKELAKKKQAPLREATTSQLPANPQEKSKATPEKSSP